MARKKWTVNATAVILFLLFSLLYLMFLLRWAESVRAKAARFYGSTTATRIEHHFAEWRLTAELAILQRAPLRNPREAEATVRYGSMAVDGTLTLEGLTLRNAVSPHILRQAAEQDYAVAVTNHQFPEGAFVMVLFSPGSGGEDYPTAVLPLKELAQRIACQLTLPLEDCILVDASGSVWASQSPDGSWREESGWSLPFRTDALPITTNRRERQLILPLSQPSGWSLVGRTSPSALLPGFAVLLYATAGLLGLLLILFMVVQHYDAANRSEAQQRLLSALRRDPLTRLGSAGELESAFRSFSLHHIVDHYSLVCMDFVNFHRFNDMFGREAGDDLLRVTGRYLLEEYLCGTRLYGDLLLFVAPSSPTLPADIRAALRQSISNKLGTHAARSAAFRFGVYPLVDDPQTFRDAYDGALLALQQAKQSHKRESEVVYDGNMRHITQLRRNIEYYMLYALNNREFRFFIQPKFHTADCGFCGGEALVRWNSRQMGFLSPAYFIPLFEENGFIAEIDFYMLQSALDLMQWLQDTGKKLFSLSVNQSRITISYPNYLERLRELTSRYTLPLHHIELEITESALTQDFDTVISLVAEMRGMGFSISMDDFGTGYSSLNTLRQLPVDTLKLDKGFLRETDHNQRGKKIIQSIIQMARDLEIRTVCEGVETDTQLELLRDIGCDMIQGYLLAKPMPGQEFVDRFVEPAYPPAHPSPSAVPQPHVLSAAV